MDSRANFQSSVVQSCKCTEASGDTKGASIIIFYNDAPRYNPGAQRECT